MLWAVDGTVSLMADDRSNGMSRATVPVDVRETDIACTLSFGTREGDHPPRLRRELVSAALRDIGISNTGDEKLTCHFTTFSRGVCLQRTTDGHEHSPLDGTLTGRERQTVDVFAAASMFLRIRYESPSGESWIFYVAHLAASQLDGFDRHGIVDVDDLFACARDTSRRLTNA